MIDRFCLAILFASCLALPSYAQYGTPPVSPAMAETYIKGITDTVVTYPSQAADILSYYAEVDISKIDMYRFNQIVANGDYQQIYNEISIVYNNRVAINNGTFDMASYEASVPAPTSPEPVLTTPEPLTTGGVPSTASVASTGIVTKVVGGAVLAAATVGPVALAFSSGGGSGGDDGIINEDDIFGRNQIPYSAPPSSFLDAEMLNYNLDALELENAHYAYARGLTGEGVTIGFYDLFTSDLTSDPELNSRIGYQNLSIPLDTLFCGSDPDLCDHGKNVMYYAAAEKNGNGTHGVAYKANLIMGGFFTDPQLLADNGAQIINFSCGGCVSQSELDYIINTKGVFVASATGNDGTANPDPTSPASLADEYDYKLLAVTGVYFTGGGAMINDYDKCGTQKEYCLTAISDSGTSFAAPQVAGAAALLKDGWGFLTAKQIGQILLYSAQDIGIAGVDEVYGHGLLDLKAASEPIGSLTTLSGSGLMTSFSASSIQQNQNAAFGDAFSRSENAKGDVVLLDSFGRDFKVKMSDNLNVASKPGMTPQNIQDFGSKAPLKTMQFNDRFSMQFKQEHNTDNSQDTISVASYDVNERTNIKLGFSTDMRDLPINEERPFERSSFISPEVFDNGFLNFSDNNQVFYQAAELKAGHGIKTKFSSFYSKNNDDDYFGANQNQFAQVTSDYSTAMIETRFSPVKNLNFNFKNGMTHEFDSILGTKFSGSFDMANGADTYFTGLEFSYDMPQDWNLFASYTLGTTQATPSAQSAFNSVDNLMSDSFAITATRSNLTSGDKLSFSVGQPIRVRSGSAKGLTQDVDRQTGAVRMVSFEQDLTPSGRTLLFQSAYEKEVNDRLNVNFAVEYASEPDHQKDKEDEASGMIKFVYKLN